MMFKGERIKIALIADPELPVPPILYGGIERIISMLIRGFIDLGNEVSLFAHADSVTPAKLFAYRGKSSNRIDDLVKNSYLINKELFSQQYDIIHNFGRLLYLLPQMPFNTPKLMSYQREPTISQITRSNKLAKKNSLAFTGCSAYISNQISPFASAFPIFNGVDLCIYNFKSVVENDAPLVFLGRIEPIKGTHIAIEVAKLTNRKLIIAGNIPNEYEFYFSNIIQPELNNQISYIGTVNDLQKNQLLGRAAALLMPIEWNEPFGIVMAEAMACGTPVIGFNRGSVPEVIIDDINGYRCDTIEEMIAAVWKIDTIDRRKVRADAEKRFSSEVIVNQYLELYYKMIYKT